MTYHIISYKLCYQPAFYALNAQWVTHFFGPLEPEDERCLSNPQAYFLDKGGAIFMGVDSRGEAVATAALRYVDAEEFQLCKMAVSPQVRGMGIGRLLLTHVLQEAAARGARRITLQSNRILTPALNLYRALGFEEVPLPAEVPYTRCNIAMCKELRVPAPSA